MRGILPQRAGELEPVDVGHHHVGDHQVRRIVGDQIDGLLAIVGHTHLVAGRGELDLQQAGDERVVVDDQQLLAARVLPLLDVAHRTSFPGSPRRRSAGLPGSLPSWTGPTSQPRGSCAARGTMGGHGERGGHEDAGTGDVPGRDGEHPAGPAAHRDARARPHDPREARDAEPRRVGQGSDRDPHDRGRGTSRTPRRRRHDRRTDVGQHGPRARDRRRDPRLSMHLRDARQDERREDRAAPRLRCRGRDHADRRSRGSRRSPTTRSRTGSRARSPGPSSRTSTSIR